MQERGLLQKLQNQENIEKERFSFQLRIRKYAEELGVNPSILLHEYANLENEYRKKNPDISNSEYEKTNVLLERSFIENIISKKRIEELENEKKIDGLTGTYNRKALDEYLGEIEKAKLDHKFKERKEDSEYYIIMIDIDHFKDFNDKYGHQFGDYILKELVNLFGSNLRKGDMLARYGGEEFAIITESNEVNAKNLADRLRKLLEAHSFTYKEENINITASFGISVWDDTAKKTIGLADQALYKAKEEGRNGVYYHNGSAIEKFTEEKHKL